MTIDRAHLASRNSILPDERKETATLFPVTASGGVDPFDTENTVKVEIAEFRNMSRRNEHLFQNVDIQGDRKVINLWVDSFASAYEVRTDDKIVRDKDGSAWIVLTAQLGMMDTRWTCACIKMRPAPA